MTYADLPSGAAVFIDASVFIHHFEPKLILKLLTELPWNPPGVVAADPDKPAPHASFLWYKFDMGKFGYKEPQWPQHQPGTPPIAGRKFMEDWTTKFIKDNADKSGSRGTCRSDRGERRRAQGRGNSGRESSPSH